MAKDVGLWIDHKRAVIVILDQQAVTIQEIESGVGRHVPYRGAPHPKSPYSAQYQQGDNQLDRQFIERLKKFYGKILTQIRGADALLILGPGEAKYELVKHLAHEKANVTIVGIETVDKMTDRQIAAWVREYFQKQPA
jgi:hypothetical protein